MSNQKLFEAEKLESSDNASPTVFPMDCQTGMKSLDDNSISLILTDPPYFIDGMGDDWDHGKLRKRAKPGVVGGIPAGQKFDPQQGVNLQAFW